MPKESPKQKKVVGRVMHEFAHGELKSGPEGKAGKVKNRKQAIAIALHEAGASKFDSKKQNEKSLAKTERKQAEGKTYQQEAEGKSHVGASGRRESTPAMGGENATTPTRRGGRAAGSSKKALYERAKSEGVAGRSKMSKQQLESALHH
jgi:hypothetical protein